MSIQTINPYQNNTNYYNKTVTNSNFQGAEPSQVNASTKTGMSTTSKWAVGTGLTALAALGIYFATKGKVKTQSFKEIQFKEAKTVEEAKKFAQEKLGITTLHENNANLDMMNTVNRWLCEEKQIGGKIPDFVNFDNAKMGIENPLSIVPITQQGKKYNALSINYDYINKFDDLIKEMFKKDDTLDLNKLISIKNGKYQILDLKYSCENLEKLVNCLNKYNKNSSYAEKMTIYDGFSNALGYLNNIQLGNNIKMRNFSDKGSFLHEMGHVHHQDTYTYFKEAMNGASRIFNDFQNDNNKQAVANKVTPYACTSPLEFVAEVYKYLRNGEKFEDDVMALYKKYHGPEV